MTENGRRAVACRPVALLSKAKGGVLMQNKNDRENSQNQNKNQNQQQNERQNKQDQQNRNQKENRK